ncbi:MAG: hypothetical protein K9L68_11110 [Spirochaetales bacterium]|nr:hypothetical protein [Spirochaetales bacterium]MCF7939135.1 hypothetical protein [Spirochaetales bacterium]
MKLNQLHRMVSRNWVFLIPVVLFAGMFGSCGQQNPDEFPRERLFTLDIGKMEGQLDLYMPRGASYSGSLNIAMREGFVYTSNSNSSRVMVFNSYGDLLNMIYHPRKGPDPVTLSRENEEGGVSNKQAETYPFEAPGEVGVAGNRHIYVVDRVPEQQRVFDEEYQAELDRVILHFDREGKFVNYLGQEGLGGTPFPRVETLHISEHNEIIVGTRTARRRLVFWFSPEGKLLYKIEVGKNLVPNKYDGREALPQIQTVYPDLDERKLYIMVDYYQRQVDEATGQMVGINYSGSAVQVLDVASGTYDRAIALPGRNVQESDFLDEKEVPIIYNFIGASKGPYFFLLAVVRENVYEMLIVDPEGKVIERRLLRIEDSELVYKDLHLSAQGILTALLVRDNAAIVAWWRADSLIEVEKDENGSF